MACFTCLPPSVKVGDLRSRLLQYEAEGRTRERVAREADRALESALSKAAEKGIAAERAGEACRWVAGAQGRRKVH